MGPQTLHPSCLTSHYKTNGINLQPLLGRRFFPTRFFGTRLQGFALILSHESIIARAGALAPGDKGAGFQWALDQGSLRKVLLLQTQEVIFSDSRLVETFLPQCQAKRAIHDNVSR